VGVKKFAYDIWGDTVNVAARMEQYSDPGRINISQTTYDLVKDDFYFTDRGELDAKHKGKMHMYFVDGVKTVS
jgi:class 3 adenylate cyclase